MEKPEQTFQAGGIQASVFLNTRTVGGKEVEIPSISFQKRYKEGAVWKSTNSLNLNDLPKAILVLGKAFDFVLQMKRDQIVEEEDVL